METQEKALSRLELEATVFNAGQMRDFAEAQVALAGRSNVGKSSLLNALARRKSLAKTSATPGKTRSINFFRVLPENFLLADLPGYGYARRSKNEREAWSKLITGYLTGTPRLMAVVLLLDCRLPPQNSDRDLAAFARHHGLPLIGVLTKADKCSQKERSQRQKEWLHYLGHMALPVSARDGLGLEALWDRLRDAVAEAPLAADAANKPDEMTGAETTGTTGATGTTGSAAGADGVDA